MIELPEYYYLFNTKIHKEDLGASISYLKLKYDIKEEDIQFLIKDETYNDIVQ